ncbi:hypothetical protein LEP1GSC131_1041 [Leptospira kirschneri str. 200802841]|uniref:Uncharacterized protein n=1 Tax=Leptospira kirschneri str. 200802841 TaxID=1193047 RepID=A0A828Y869_9LEPT|nr:hypothetical protein LEP1GSC131_1041 [Leptospira kirschneri str. 200802841]
MRNSFLQAVITKLKNLNRIAKHMLNEVSELKKQLRIQAKGLDLSDVRDEIPLLRSRSS